MIRKSGWLFVATLFSLSIIGRTVKLDSNYHLRQGILLYIYSGHLFPSNVLMERNEISFR